MATPRRKSRKTTTVGGAALVALLVLAAFASSAHARFLYVGDFGDADRIFGFNMNVSTGQLSQLAADSLGAADPHQFAISPDGRFLYASRSAAIGIAVYSINQANGLLTAQQPLVLEAGIPWAPAVSADGRWLFMTNSGSSDNVLAFAVNSLTGALTQIGSPLPAGDGPLGIALTPNAKYLYTANIGADTVSAFSVNQTTGQLTSITGLGLAGTDPTAVITDPAGRYLYVSLGATDRIAAYAINAGTGGLTQVSDSPFPAGDTPSQMAISPDGQYLYAGNTGTPDSVSAYRINAATGQLTALSGSPFTAGGISMPEQAAISPDGRFLYFSNQVAVTVTGYSVGSNGQLSQLTNSPFSTPVPGGAGVAIGANAIVPNQPPQASFTASAGGLGEATTFNASGSSDVDGTVARFDWDFGDGSTASDAGATPSHTYTQAGAYTATLTLTDNEGCSTSSIYTGQTALCNGSSQAQATRQVTVSGSAADADPAVLKLTLDGSRKQRLNRRSGVAVTVECASSDCTLDLGGKITPPRGKREAVSLRSIKNRKLTAGKQVKLRLKYRKRDFATLRRLLHRSGSLSVKISGAAKDSSQTATAKRTVKLTKAKQKKRGRK